MRDIPLIDAIRARFAPAADATPLARTLRGLAVLLGYPDEAVQSHGFEVADAIRAEGALPLESLGAIDALAAALARDDLLDVQAAWVDTFDRGRAAALYLFEHVHGESRDRGQAMVDLQAMYRADGYAQLGRELPDYLPAYLEWLSLRTPALAREGLRDVRALLEPIARTLARRGSPWAAVLLALLRLAGDADPAATVAAGAADDDRSPAALDAAWAEAPVTFMGACSPQASPSSQPAPREQVVELRRSVNRSSQGVRP